MKFYESWEMQKGTLLCRFMMPAGKRSNYDSSRADFLGELFFVQTKRLSQRLVVHTHSVGAFPR